MTVSESSFISFQSHLQCTKKCLDLTFGPKFSPRQGVTGANTNRKGQFSGCYILILVKSFKLKNLANHIKNTYEHLLPLDLQSKVNNLQKQPAKLFYIDKMILKNNCALCRTVNCDSFGGILKSLFRGGHYNRHFNNDTEKNLKN